MEELAQPPQQLGPQAEVLPTGGRAEVVGASRQETGPCFRPRAKPMGGPDSSSIGAAKPQEAFRRAAPFCACGTPIAIAIGATPSPGLVYSFTRSIYSPVRVSIWINSPNSTNDGQANSAPVSTLQGLVTLVAVLPRAPGSQYSIFKTT